VHAAVQRNSGIGAAETEESVMLERIRRRKRWHSQRSFTPDSLTEALERQGVTFDRILQPVVDALDATVIARTLAGRVKRELPDHRIRLEA
jgi:hypothetical protein